jgi:hypothetical protein
MNKTPSMATCSRCRLKFFTPLTLVSDPVEAENYLRDKFIAHECKRENGKVYPIRERMAG